jgi:hypothetical protein
MRPRSWLVTTLLTLLLTGFVLIQARLRTGLPAHRTAAARHSELRHPPRARRVVTADGLVRWQLGQASHWRASLLQQGGGCLCRAGLPMIP